MKYDKIQKPKKIEKYKNGAIRSSTENKGRFDLIPIIPLFRLAYHYERGAKIYLPRNWEAGMSQSRFYDSTLRHLMKYFGGDRSEDHLAAAAWNVFAMIDQEHRFDRGTLSREFDDLPKSRFNFDEFDETKKNRKKKVKKNAKKKRKR